MNTKLIEHGIQTEDAEIRAHVAPVVHRIYVFRTDSILELLKRQTFKTAYATQEGVNVDTARGYLIPCVDVPDLRSIYFCEAKDWWTKFRKTDTTSRKGWLAVLLVKKVMECGRFPLWVDVRIVKNVQVDIQGSDIIAFMGCRVQVKCDYEAGAKELGGTGNLFIQTHECNPLKRY